MEKNSARDILYREMEELWKDEGFVEQQKKLFEAELTFQMQYLEEKETTTMNA